MKIDNIDEVEEFAKEMNYFFTYIERTNSDLKNELRIKELEQDDLLHEIELSKLNAFELSKVAVRLRNVRQERRVIKDKLEFISTLKGFADKYNNKFGLHGMKSTDYLCFNWKGYEDLHKTNKTLFSFLFQ